MNIDEKIKQFENSLKNIYSDIEIGHYLSEDDEIFFIWHNSKSLANNSEFNSMAGSLIRKVFFNNNIFNVCFYFDYDKSIEAYNIKTKELKLKFEKKIDGKNSAVLNKYNEFINSICSNIETYEEQNNAKSILEIKLSSKKNNNSINKNYVDMVSGNEYSIFVPSERLVA